MAGFWTENHYLHEQTFDLTLTVEMAWSKYANRVDPLVQHISLLVESECYDTNLVLLGDDADKRVWYTRGSSIFFNYMVG